MDIHFLTVQVIHVVSLLQSLISMFHNLMYRLLFISVQYQGDVQGKGMTFESGIVFVHRKGMALRSGMVFV